jgi:hypothetical protein
MTQFTEVFQSLPQFIEEMEPDLEMVYDYVTEQLCTEDLTDTEWSQVIDLFNSFQ